MWCVRALEPCYTNVPMFPVVLCALCAHVSGRGVECLVTCSQMCPYSLQLHAGEDFRWVLGSSSVALHLVFSDKVLRWSWSLSILLGWLVLNLSQLSISLSPFQWWDYRHTALLSSYVGSCRSRLKSLCLHGRHFISWAISLVPYTIVFNSNYMVLPQTEILVTLLLVGIWWEYDVLCSHAEASLQINEMLSVTTQSRNTLWQLLGYGSGMEHFPSMH